MSNPPKKARKFKKHASPSKKKTLVVVEVPAEKLAKKPTARRQSAGVLIIDTPDVSVSKKKAPAKAKRSKGIKLLSEATLLEEAYDDDDGDDDDDDDDDQQRDDERTKSDNDKDDLNNTNDEEEEEFVHTPDDSVPTDDENIDDEEYKRINKEMYSDVNVELKDTELEGEGKVDKEMTDDGHVDAEHKNKTEVPLPSSSISSDNATKFLNFDNIPSADTEIISMMDIKVQHEDLNATISTTSALDSSTLTAIHQRLPDLENEVKILRSVDHNLTIHATIKYEVPTVVKEYLETSLDDTLYKHKALYHSLMESILEDEDAMDNGVADKLKKRKPDDADKDEGPPAGPD
ncbi:hypothetical protein Tco_0875123 [Tanacetum coccineum]|uniref:Uncharacterized protein n=1 Tax=Tanacetum coccineum TaxID=301880 RepID=A0ABQ5BRE1_9ASTR